jgi:hypothetical protein
MLMALDISGILQLGLFCLAALVLMGGMTAFAVWRILRMNKPVFIPLGPRLTVQSGRGGLRQVLSDLRRTLRNRNPEYASMVAPSVSRNQIALRLLINIVNASDRAAELKFWETFQGPELTLHLGDLVLAGKLFAYCPALGYLWVIFEIEGEAQHLLPSEHIRAHFQIDHAGYRHQSEILGRDMRRSLINQLALSREAN